MDTKADTGDSGKNEKKETIEIKDDERESAVKCVVCYEWIRHDVYSCGGLVPHLHCKKCFAGIRDGGKKTEDGLVSCSVCREGGLTRMRALEKKRDDLVTWCPHVHCTFGCFLDQLETDMKVHLDECRQRPLPCAFDYHCDKPGEKIDCKFQGTRSEFKKHLIDVHGFGLADTGGFDVMVLHPDSRLRNKHRHNYVVTFEDDDDMFVLCLEVPIADNSIEICMLPVALSWDRGDGITLFYGQRKYTELYVLHTYAWSYGRFLEWWRDPKRGGSPENMFGWRVLYNKLPKDTLTMENWHMFASCCVAQGRFDFNDPEPLVNKMAQALVTGINERHKAGAKRKRETDDNDEKDAKDDEKKKEKKARSGDSDADTKETEAETKKKAWFRGLRALDIVAYQQDRVWFPVLVERAAVCDQKDGHWSIYLDVTGVATLTVPCGCLVSDREPALFRSVAPLEDLPDCDLRWANQRTVDRLVRSFVALVGVSRSIDFYDDPVEGPGRWVQATIEDFQGDKNQNVWIKVAEGRSTMYGLWHVLRSGKIAPMGRYTGVDASSSAARRS